MSTVLTVSSQTLRRTGPGRHTISANFYKQENEGSIFSNKNDENHMQTLKRNAEPYELKVKRG